MPSSSHDRHTPAEKYRHSAFWYAFVGQISEIESGVEVIFSLQAYYSSSARKISRIFMGASITSGYNAIKSMRPKLDRLERHLLWWYDSGMNQFASSTNHGAAGQVGLQLPKVAAEVVDFAVAHLSSPLELSRANAAQFLASKHVDLTPYTSEVRRALVSERSREVLLELCDLLSLNPNLAEQFAPHLVSLLNHKDISVAARAAKVLASSAATAEVAFVPVWMRYFASPESPALVPSSFRENLVTSRHEFEHICKDHVSFFVDASQQSQIEHLQKISIQGLQVDSYHRAFFSAAICHPDHEVRESGFRLLARLGRCSTPFPQEACDMIEAALAFASTYYLRPEITLDTRRNYIEACRSLEGSAALSRMLMEFAQHVDANEAVFLLFSVADMCPSECAEDAICELALYMGSDIDATIQNSAAQNLATLSKTLPLEVRERAVQELCFAVCEELGKADPSVEQLGLLPRTLGNAGGDHATIVDFCCGLLKKLPSDLTELSVAEILVQRLGQVEDESVSDRIRIILDYLDTSPNSDVKKAAGRRHPTYPSGSITKGRS
jgi:hypothetical protein